MILKTERILIKPFTIDIIDAASTKDYKKLSYLGINANSEWPDKDLLEALPLFRKMICEYGVTGFNAWSIVDRQTNDIIGSIGFKSSPDSYGSIEVGFGIVPGKRRKGYCIEALQEIIDWVKSKNKVKIIKAQCDSSNEGSKKVLEKAGFVIKGENNGIISWEKKVK